MKKSSLVLPGQPQQVDGAELQRIIAEAIPLVDQEAMFHAGTLSVYLFARAPFAITRTVVKVPLAQFIAIANLACNQIAVPMLAEAYKQLPPPPKADPAQAQ